MGSKLDIAATDQMRPTATTAMVIRTIHASICIPFVLSLPTGACTFFRRASVRWFTDAQNFLKQT